jgi:hypothetical protein
MGMRELIRRMRIEPEIFTLVGGRSIQVGGKSVLFRPHFDRRWSLIVRGGAFGRFGPPDVISYERLSFWQSRQVDRLKGAFAQQPSAAAG